ncbi:transcription termination factor 3, mitochondrial [Spea bombifrons]|uniref:transcription termination factor 3, mitochondrial n=1 Tax=Spea bombifrons TaxID=233779 RepID=UPI0023498814|nr:transcription termination factor 3, mitochondrial [Spea bombifrons]
MTLAVCRIGRRCRLLNLTNCVSFSNTLKDSKEVSQILLRRTEIAGTRQLACPTGAIDVTRSCILLPGGRTARYSTTVAQPHSDLPSVTSDQQQEKAVILNTDIEADLQDLESLPPLSPLEEISENEAVQIDADPPISPASFSLKDYVDRSETLQKLVNLGVDLSKIEKRPNVANVLLRLDFEKDVSKILLFLKDVGLEDHQLGPYLTKNPFILSEDLENLQTRVAYLSRKKFGKEAITRMVSRAPYLLNFSVERLDNRLGFFQKELGLSAEKTRDLVTRFPRMVTGSLEPVRENLKVCEIELGFRKNEIQHIALRVPKLLTSNKKKLTETFDYVHNKMGIPHHIIIKFPQVFNTNLLRLKERHQYLTFLGRAVYDPTQPNYVSLDKIASLPNDCFCDEVAKTSVQEFEHFLKTL